MSEAATNKVTTQNATATGKFMALLKSGFRPQTLSSDGFSSALDEAVSASIQKADDLSDRRDLAAPSVEREASRPAPKAETARKDVGKEATPRETDSQDTRRVETRDSQKQAETTRPEKNEEDTAADAPVVASKIQAQKEPSSATKAQKIDPRVTDKQTNNAGDGLETSIETQSVLTQQNLGEAQNENEDNGQTEDAANALLNLAEAEQAALALLNKMIEKHDTILSLRETDATRTQDEETGSDALADMMTAQDKTPTLQDLMDARATKTGLHADAQGERKNGPLASSNSQNTAASFANVDPLASAQTGNGETSGKDDLSKSDLLKLVKQLDMAKETQPTVNNLQNIAAKAVQTAQGQDGPTAATGSTANLSGVSGSSAPTPTATGAKLASLYDAHGTNATHAAKGGPSSQLNVVEQVSVHLHKQVKAGSDQMTLQLRPEELGRIDIKLEFGDDKTVTGKVIVDNPTTLEMLTKDASSLQRALQDAGLHADSGCLQFSLRGDGQSSTAFQNQQGSNRQNADSASRILAENDNMLDDLATAETYYIAPNRVNLRV